MRESLDNNCALRRGCIFGIAIYTDIHSLLPVFISCIYTYATWQKKLKFTYCTGTSVSILWIIYNIFVGAYVSIIGNIFECVASMIGLYRLAKVHKEVIQ